MLNKLNNWYKKYSLNIYKYNINDLISGFDKKTKDEVLKRIKDNGISFSVFNKNRHQSALDLGLCLCDVYERASRNEKGAPVLDSTYDGSKVKLFDIAEQDYAKLPKKYRGLYQYDDSTGRYYPRGNVKENDHTLILKYKKGANKDQVQDMISSLYGLYHNGNLTELYNTLSQLSKLTKVENIDDKKRNLENSGSNILAQEQNREIQRKDSILKGNNEKKQIKESLKRAKENLKTIKEKKVSDLKKRHELELEALKKRHLNEEDKQKKDFEEREQSINENSTEENKRIVLNYAEKRKQNYI